MSELLIKGALLQDPSQQLNRVADIYIKDGLISEIGDDLKQDCETIDAAGLSLIPAAIDMQARLREPGASEKGNIATETAAACKGGIASLVCMPDTKPVIDSVAVVELIADRAEQAQQAKVYPMGALTAGLEGKQLAPIMSLSDAGCIAFGNVMLPLADNRVLRRALEYASTFDLLVVLQANDVSLSAGGVAHEGAFATRLGLPGIPDFAESCALAQILAINEEIGARIHIACVSTRRAVEMIDAAKRKGASITASTAMHHLFLTDIDIEAFNSACYVLPPLRDQADREALRMGLKYGIIDAIVSDHQPQDKDSKEAPFAATEPGISGLDSFMPLGLKLVADGILDMDGLIKAVASQPAAILGLAQGAIKLGAPADLCLIAPDKDYYFEPDAILSKGKNTPFKGWEMRGQIVRTLVDGQTRYQA